VRIRRTVGALLTGGLVLAAFAQPASATITKGAISTVVNAKAYAIFDLAAPYGTIGIGSTAPGDPAGETCLKFALDLGFNMWTSDATNGDIFEAGGVVQYASVLDDFTPNPDPCIVNAQNVSLTGKSLTNTTTNTVDFTGISQVVNIDHGIKASAQSFYLVDHPAGASITSVSGVDFDPLTVNVSFTTLSATRKLVTVTPVLEVISKSKLDNPNLYGPPCELQSIDRDPTTGAWAAETSISQVYSICAQDNAIQTAAKSPKWSLHSSGGEGVTSLTWSSALTVGPSLWEQTLGKCKLLDQDSRVLQCKGDWGDALPFTISVRGGSTVTGGSPYGNPAGKSDPEGITTPTVALLGSGDTTGA
jgi:hypothetical protein